MSYQPDEYWTRLHRRDDLSSVGQSGLPVGMNRWIYAAAARRIGDFIGAHGIVPATVFEVGAGTGFWVDWWMRRGASVDGCDLAPAAVERLSDRFPGRFVHLDIAEGPPVKQYDLVLVMNVLLHLTNDEAFSMALGNIAAGVAPGGYLLMLEPVQVKSGYRHTYPDAASSKARPAHFYVDPLRSAGLEVVTIERATAIGSDPIEANNRSMFVVETIIWRSLKLPGKVSATLGSAAGRIIYAVDPIMLRLGFGDSSKLVLLRRPGVA